MVSSGDDDDDGSGAITTAGTDRPTRTDICGAAKEGIDDGDGPKTNAVVAGRCEDAPTVTLGGGAGDADGGGMAPPGNGNKGTPNEPGTIPAETAEPAAG